MRKKEILSYGLAWMEHEDIMSREISQTEKDFHDIVYMWTLPSLPWNLFFFFLKKNFNSWKQRVES